MAEPAVASGVRIPDELQPMLRPLADLTPYPRNAQKHDPNDVERFRAVLRQFGWTQPIVAWAHDGKLYISAGHLRYLAAQAEGLTEVPVLVRRDWSETEFRAYTIADNQWTKRAAWDVVLLRDELVDLDTGEIDLTLTGFEKRDIYAMVHGKTKQDEELVPAPEDGVVVRLTFPAAVWLAKRDEVLGILQRFEKTYLCHTKVEE